MLDAVLGILNTALLAVTAGAAVWGVNTWRRELIGRKKADTAEEVLAGFYRARDTIERARGPGSFGSEGQTRPRAQDEDPNDAEMMNAYYAPAERLFAQEEFFAEFEASQYRFMALFGPHYQEQFRKVFHARSRVIVASGMLIRLYRQPRGRPEMHDVQVARLEDDIWHVDDGEPDRISDEVKEAVAVIEEVCQRALGLKQEAPQTE